MSKVKAIEKNKILSLGSFVWLFLIPLSIVNYWQAEVWKIIQWLKVCCRKAFVCIVHCVMHSFNSDTYWSTKSLCSNWKFSLVVLTNCPIVLGKGCNFCDSTHYISRSYIWVGGAFIERLRKCPWQCVSTAFLLMFLFVLHHHFCFRVYCWYHNRFNLQDLMSVLVSPVAVRIKSSQRFNSAWA